MHNETRFDEVIDPVDGTRWVVDADFLSSKWTCIWDRGCEGIEAAPNASAGLGCCSVGAELHDDDEAMRIAALAATLDPARFEQHERAAATSIFVDDSRRHTKVIDGACVFLNRPDFSGGHGCALHHGAVAAGESPIDWKPTVCWQVPLRVVDQADDRGEHKVLRPWVRSDLGADESTMAWCCTERRAEMSSAYVGDTPVAESLFDELCATVGPEVAVELRRRYSTPE